jgi:uncharacterized protein (TIGR03437 family)
MKNLLVYSFALSAPLWSQTAVSPTINALPTRQFGQPSLANPLTQASPNLVEGREFDAPGPVAFDTSVSPAIMYVADIGNNRVLAFKSIAALTAGNFASLVIGQQDFFSTLAQGPSNSQSTLSTGLSSPTGLAVDSKGNLYVADSGNNRILRFPAPFNQPAGSPPQPDLVIGQKGFNTGYSANLGQNSNPQSSTLYFSSGGSSYLVGMTIDSNGNLWTTDPGNNRVLMYPVANLTAGAVQPVATVVLGQTSFTTNSLVSNPNQLTASITVQPSSLAFASSGDLYVADAYSRVLYYQGPTISTGQSATRILGIAAQPASGTSTIYPTQYTLGFPNSNNNLIPPQGVFTQGNHVYVADTAANRIVEYDVPANWPVYSTTVPSPPALAVYGQIGFNAGQANQAQAQPSAYTLSGPYAGAFVGTQMWIADTGNNRVLAFQPTSTGYSNASIVVGQLDYIYNAPNLIVGVELFLSGNGLSASGMVLDNSVSPPHLYISDPGNNRILGFNNALTVGATTPPAAADMVIGQPNFKTSEINYPSGNALSPSATGLYEPIGVAVDNKGNLYVADAGNGRVVRFPAPFSQAGCPSACAAQPTANLVLGQNNFTTVIQNASANSMHTPWGLALFADDPGAVPLGGSIAVSDSYYNRVLVFKKPSGGDFSSGQSAATVIGQSSFSAVTPGNSQGQFYAPRGICSDTSDRLYVADSGNGRVMEFTQAPEGTTNGPTATNSITGLNNPYAVAINSSTTELWVTNTNSDYIYRYPEYNTCQLISCNVTATLYTSAPPLGLAIDASGNVITGDVANRVTFYFAQAFYRNAANYAAQQPLAPGMLAVLGRLGLAMSIQNGAATTNPWATTIGDINVTVNGVAAPIYATSSGYGAIYFQVPYETPTSGTVNVIVTQHSTGAVLSVGTFTMGVANPGFFTTSQLGIGPVAATNADGTVNTPTNGANRGAGVTFYLTGLGEVPGAPADGYAPSAAANAPVAPLVYIQGQAATVSYSGPGAFAGGWQINATIPTTAVPNSANSVVLTYLGFGSNYVGTTSSDGITPGADQKTTLSTGTTIYVGK